MSTTHISIVVDATEFHNALKNGLLCAANDSTLPSLSAVKLEVRDGYLYVVSTDRFRLGVTRVKLEFGAPDADALVPAREIKQLVTVLKPVRADKERKTVRVSIPFSDDAADTVSWARSDGLSGTVDQVDAQFPKWRGLVRGAMESTYRVPVRHPWAATPEYLGAFTKVVGAEPHAPIVSYTPEPGRPALFTVGENFIGLLMPVRLPDDPGGDAVLKIWMEV